MRTVIAVYTLNSTLRYSGVAVAPDTLALLVLSTSTVGLYTRTKYEQHGHTRRHFKYWLMSCILSQLLYFNENCL